jgi:hypothetical protein
MEIDITALIREFGPSIILLIAGLLIVRGANKSNEQQNENMLALITVQGETNKEIALLTEAWQRREEKADESRQRMTDAASKMLASIAEAQRDITSVAVELHKLLEKIDRIVNAVTVLARSEQVEGVAQDLGALAAQINELTDKLNNAVILANGGRDPAPLVVPEPEVE